MLTRQLVTDIQEAAETGDEVPEEDEVAGVPKEAVVVTVPSDFALEESCQALLDELASIIYRCAATGACCTLCLLELSKPSQGHTGLYKSSAVSTEGCP